MTVEPPIHDELLVETVPEADHPRAYSELVTSLMVVWDCSMAEAERRMEPYTLGQCETIIREFWRARR